MKNPLKITLWCSAAALILAQFIRTDFSNPPTVKEPNWDSPQTRALAQRACFDCHSHQANLPWYGQIAPVRWVLSSHLHEGREHLNFSAVDGSEEVHEMVEEIRDGGMPLLPYRWIHSHARLTPAETDSLVSGLQKTFAAPTLK